MRTAIRGVIASRRWIVLVVVASVVLQAQANAKTKIDLGSAKSFAVLGGSTVTNTGSSVIDGSLGVSPGTAITGFLAIDGGPGVVTAPGTINIADAVAGQAQTDVTTAFNLLAGLAPNADLTGQDLGGKTLLPGVYKFDSSAQLTGALTLNALGSADSVFVFQIGSTLTTASASSVMMINDGGGTDGCNVYWQVGSSATLGTTTAFEGNILADQSITLNTGASIESGRALAEHGAVTLDTNNIGCKDCQSPASVPEAPSFTLFLGGDSVPCARDVPSNASAARCASDRMTPNSVCLAGSAARNRTR